MLLEDWAASDGDSLADAVLKERQSAKWPDRVSVLVSFLGLLASAIWFALTGSHVALVAMVVTAVWSVNSGNGVELYDTHTLLMITERRAQALERTLRELQRDVCELRRRRL